MNINALLRIYPFLETGIIGSSVLNNTIPYIKLGNGNKLNIQSDTFINTIYLSIFSLLLLLS